MVRTGKSRAVTRTRFPGGEQRRPKHRRIEQMSDYQQARLEHNWRVKCLDTGEVLAFEPGREHEQVFEGGPDPFWDAVTCAAACLRGEVDPAR